MPLVQRAFDQWRSLEAESCDDLLTVNGAVYVAPEGHTMLQGVERAARAHGLPLTCLSRAQTADRLWLNSAGACCGWTDAWGPSQIWRIITV